MNLSHSTTFHTFAIHPPAPCFFALPSSHNRGLPVVVLHRSPLASDWNPQTKVQPNKTSKKFRMEIGASQGPPENPPVGVVQSKEQFMQFQVFLKKTLTPNHPKTTRNFPRHFAVSCPAYLHEPLPWVTSPLRPQGLKGRCQALTFNCPTRASWALSCSYECKCSVTAVANAVVCHYGLKAASLCSRCFSFEIKTHPQRSIRICVSLSLELKWNFTFLHGIQQLAVWSSLFNDGKECMQTNIALDIHPFQQKTLQKWGCCTALLIYSSVPQIIEILLCLHASISSFLLWLFSSPALQTESVVCPCIVSCDFVWARKSHGKRISSGQPWRNKHAETARWSK